MSYSTDFEWSSPRRKRVDIFLYDRCRPPVAVNIRTPAAKIRWAVQSVVDGGVESMEQLMTGSPPSSTHASHAAQVIARAAATTAAVQAGRSQCWPHCANVLRVAPYFSSGPSPHYSCIVLIRSAVSRDSINSLSFTLAKHVIGGFFFQFFLILILPTSIVFQCGEPRGVFASSSV